MRIYIPWSFPHSNSFENNSLELRREWKYSCHACYSNDVSDHMRFAFTCIVTFSFSLSYTQYVYIDFFLLRTISAQILRNLSKKISRNVIDLVIIDTKRGIYITLFYHAFTSLLFQRTIPCPWSRESNEKLF